MSAVANSARVTEISHQLIESNMEWKVSNPLPQESERVKIPLMNLEWYVLLLFLIQNK